MSLRARLRASSRYARDIARFGMIPACALLPSPLASRFALVTGARKEGRLPHELEVRRRMEENLRQVLGERYSTDERQRIALEYQRLMWRGTMDRMRIAGSRRLLREQVRIAGAERLQQALREGHGAIICAGHYGPYLASVARLGEEGFPVTLVRRSIDTLTEYAEQYAETTAPGQAYQQTLHHRSLGRFLRETIYAGQDQFAAGVQLAKSLRANRVVISFIDPPPLPEEQFKAISVPFLDHTVKLLAGSLTIAQRQGAPIFFMLPHRAPDHRYTTLELLPITPEARPAATLARCLALLEEAIRAHPEEWLYWPKTDDLRALGLLAGGELAAQTSDSVGAQPVAQ